MYFSALSIPISFWFCMFLSCNPTREEVQCIRKSSLNGESHAIVLLHSFISANCLKRSFATLILLRLKEGELGVNQEFKQTVTNDLVFFHCISNLCGSTELRNLTDNMPEKIWVLKCSRILKTIFSFVKNYVLAFRMLASAAWGYFAAKAKFVYKASRIFFQAKKCLASLLGFLTNILTLENLHVLLVQISILW